MPGTIGTPIVLETHTEGETHHPSAQVELHNRYPELGPASEGFPGNTRRVVEVVCQGPIFLTAREAADLGERLIGHSRVLTLDTAP